MFIDAAEHDAKYTQLMEAMKNRDCEEISKLLLQNVGRDAETIALRRACIANDVDIVRLLLSHNVNVHACNEYALRTAAYLGYTELVKLLLEHGANLYIWDNQPLKTACYGGHAATAKVLIAHGATLSSDRKNILLSIVASDQYDLLTVLLDSLTFSQGEKDNLLRCIVTIEGDKVEAVKILLQKGANIHMNNNNVLWTAVIKGAVNTVRLLLRKGANIFAVNPVYGFITGHEIICCAAGNIDIIRILLAFYTNGVHSFYPVGATITYDAEKQKELARLHSWFNKDPEKHSRIMYVKEYKMEYYLYYLVHLYSSNIIEVKEKEKEKEKNNKVERFLNIASRLHDDVRQVLINRSINIGSNYISNIGKYLDKEVEEALLEEFE